MQMKPIKEIMTSEIIWVTPETQACEAITVMKTKKISCLLVLHDKTPVGIFTERDIVRAMHGGASFQNTKIHDLVSTPVITAEENIDLHEAYNIIATNEIRHLVVVDSNGEIIGIVTQTDILNNLGVEFFVEFKKISKLMVRNIVSVNKECLVKNAVSRMAEISISCVVVEEERRPVGIITERDVARLAYEGTDLDEVKIGELMSSPVVTIHADTPVQEAVELMAKERIRRVIVVDKDGRLEGLITQFDLVKGLETDYVRSLKAVIKEKDKKLLEAFKALQDKSMILENILHSSTRQGIFTTDLDFRITYFNPMAEKLLCRKAQEAIGKTVEEALCKEIDIWKCFQNTVKNIQTEGPCCSIERCIGSEMRCIEIEIFGIYDCHKKLVGYANFCTDVTDQKKDEENLRKSEEKFRLLYGNIPIPYQSLDENGCFIEVNKAFCEKLGYSRKELLGSSFQDLLPSSYADFFKEQFSILKGKGVLDALELELKRKDGSLVTALFTGRIGYDQHGKFKQTHSTWEDITEQKRSRKELEKAFKEVKEKSRDLEKFHKVTVGRELEMIRLKEEVNRLHARLGESKKY